MKVLTKGKILLTLILILHSILVNGQNCSLVSGNKNKKDGTDTKGGITSSKDFYSLLIRKAINYSDNSVPPIYTVYLLAASKAVLTDSMLNTRGTFEFILLDNSILTINNVTYSNNPLGSCCSLGFTSEISEEQIKILAQNPVVTLNVKEVMLTTTFAPKKQKRQQTICDCLLR